MQKFEKVGEIEVATRVLDEFAFASVSQGIKWENLLSLMLKGVSIRSSKVPKGQYGKAL